MNNGLYRLLDYNTNFHLSDLSVYQCKVYIGVEIPMLNTLSRLFVRIDVEISNIGVKGTRGQ